MTLSYPEVGAVAGPGPLPAGYHHLHHRTRVGRGAAQFAAAGRAVTTWRMHRAAGVRILGPPPRCGGGAPGVRGVWGGARAGRGRPPGGAPGGAPRG
ncbi:DUF1990 family protein, partial [Kitasatospora sp. NPDC059571]|uniref:DUF1990 family protein n=1 Tax=Kitasatospora sp. NPDC059571 TaxID=3346871 RepID=UPI0036ABC060